MKFNIIMLHMNDCNFSFISLNNHYISKLWNFIFSWVVIKNEICPVRNVIISPFTVKIITDEFIVTILWN